MKEGARAFQIIEDCSPKLYKKSDVFGEKIGNYFLLWNVGPSWKHFGRANTVWNVDVNSSHFSNFEWIITWVRISKIIELCGECRYFFAFSFQAHSNLSYLITSDITWKFQVFTFKSISWKKWLTIFRFYSCSFEKSLLPSSNGRKKSWKDFLKRVCSQSTFTDFLPFTAALSPV